MMKNDGGVAFPNLPGADGMSLRDYFAAAALTGALKDHDNTKRMVEEADRAKIDIEEYIARSMYALADAMLAERAK